MDINNIPDLITGIYTYLITIANDHHILRSLPLTINIFIPKDTFSKLFNELNIPKQIKEGIIQSINFLDIIQINNFNIKLFNLTKEGKYQESIMKLDSKIDIPEIPNNINFNFIITSDEKTKSILNMEETLDYSEYEKLLSISDAIHTFMTKYNSIYIPFSSSHTRDMLIASLFSNKIYSNNEKNFAMWLKTPAKLFKDSNLDKVFMYSLLNNIIIKCNQDPKTKNYNEVVSFLNEFLKNRHPNINLQNYTQTTPYQDISQKCNFIQQILLKDINMEDEFIQTDYFNPDYDIFESCGINLHLYRNATEPDLLEPTNLNTQVENENIAARAGLGLLSSNSQVGGLNRNKHKTKDNINKKNTTRHIYINKMQGKNNKRLHTKKYKKKTFSKKIHN